MGWLDKLLGRDKEQAEAPPETAPRETAQSEADLAEERAAAARDESLEAEGRIPPGAG